MEVGTNTYSAFSAELSDGSACESSNQPTHGLHQLETRPWSHLHKAFTINWAPLRGYAPPTPLQSDIQNPDEDTKRPNGTNSRCSSLASPALVADSAETSISQPVLLPNGPTLLTDPTDLNRVHPMYPRLHLAVFHISTNVSKLRAFQQRCRSTHCSFSYLHLVVSLDSKLISFVIYK